MHILVLAPYSRPHEHTNAEGSGMNQFIRESSLALAQAGHTVTILIRRSRKDDPESIFLSPNLTIRFVSNGIPARLGRDEVFAALQETPLDTGKLPDFDLILAHYWLSIPWLQQLASHYHGRILYCSHANTFNPNRVKHPQTALLAEASILSRVTWCAMTEAEATLMSTILPSDRLVLASPGINIPDIKPIPTNEILFVGRQNTAKGFDLFIELANTFPDVSFTAIGREETAISLPANVTQMGTLPLTKTYERIAGAQLVVCPSRYEHFGFVPLASVLLDTPVIATAHGVAPEVIENANGYIANPDTASLAEALQHFLRTGISDAADTTKQTLKDQYSWTRWVDALTAKTHSPVHPYQGKFATVQTTLRHLANSHVWFETVTLPGSIHLILKDEQGRYGFVEEVRPEQPEPIVRVLSGAMEADEDPLAAARRELQEEIGFQAATFTLLWHSRETGTIQNNRYYYIVSNYTKDSTSALEPGEDIRGVHFFTTEEILEKLEAGDFGSSHTAVALHKLCGTVL